MKTVVMGCSPMTPFGSSLPWAPEYRILASLGCWKSVGLVFWAYVCPSTFALGRFPGYCWYLCNAQPSSFEPEWDWLVVYTCLFDGQTPRS